MTKTINISLPVGMYQDAKRVLKEKQYTSFSELMRNSLRQTLYPELTINGFTPEFEDEVLRIAATPDDNDLVWETEEDIDKYFQQVKKKTKASDDKN
ncbi:hypothetical protein A2630_03260 [Candidatus Woesebacteria bacterium RIFCSPHIGHO2_01_FULL_44_10]|uniref:Uncharacterized protein n=1 Tax=Candidatus Woesebacteria bacterium RIFCSPLOWO2_01_FULL_44_14 TaxID=1802525 RepID=A0A1F8BY56_9BACT|nr:MAG: hypothetical protein A2630_03260 [Candidatus Woesebacteria bacterium RIFCSPHIGHO2_01_FULL_44_10]OGM56429.1 MAG: hypothetical protein A3F62_01920 [Candidatus Woesebacteria bacterium RIFCSPHIGHO2_12_FULL_44_11]OGM68830.1 MAG: hypothetical protein A2975_00465 [Candidatus Woesebacteria bacterium RIFCSPLOWO2_01_FULL_44_14]